MTSDLGIGVVDGPEVVSELGAAERRGYGEVAERGGVAERFVRAEGDDLCEEGFWLFALFSRVDATVLNTTWSEGPMPSNTCLYGKYGWAYQRVKPSAGIHQVPAPVGDDVPVERVGIVALRSDEPRAATG